MCRGAGSGGDWRELAELQEKAAPGSLRRRGGETKAGTEPQGTASRTARQQRSTLAQSRVYRSIRARASAPRPKAAVGAESWPQPPGHQEGRATGAAPPGLGLHCVGQNLVTRSSGPEGIRRNYTKWLKTFTTGSCRHPAP